jgi:hypothetical protein
MEEDGELMAEINAAADRAEEAKPKTENITALAAMLASQFTNRDETEILEKIKDVWRSRELYW